MKFFKNKMKNLKLGSLGMATAVVLLVAAGWYLQTDKVGISPKSNLVLSNIEALTIDLEEVTITCDRYEDKGKCFREDIMAWKLCGQYSYHPCVFSGYQVDYCKEPC